MKTETLVLGGLALLGVGVGAYAVMKNPNKRTASSPKTGSSFPAVDPSTNPPGVTPAMPSTSQVVGDAAAQAAAEKAERERLAAIQAELARQEAERRAKEHQDEIRRLTSAAAAVENDQILVLQRIKAITDDNSRLQDFTQQYISEQLSSGRFNGLVDACKLAVWNNCGRNALGRCDDDNYPACDWHYTTTNGYLKGSWNGNTDLNPWGLISQEARDPNNPNGGPARLARWKEEQRKPLEADLARLEVQYQGIVRELRERFGVEFQSVKPEAHSYKP